MQKYYNAQALEGAPTCIFNRGKLNKKFPVLLSRLLPNRQELDTMLKVSKLTHTSTPTTRAKNEHKNADSKKHKDHALYRDPDGVRNAKEEDRLPSKIWYTTVTDSEEFIEATIRASKDSRGRERTLVGHAVVLSFPDDLVAWFNALPHSDRAATLDEMDVLYREMMERRFPGTTRTDARHTDKHRPHYESHTLKYGPDGEKKYATKDMKPDSPGVTALLTKGLFNKKKRVALGKSGKRWNSIEAVNMTRHFHRLINFHISQKAQPERDEIMEKAKVWHQVLFDNASEPGERRRNKQLARQQAIKDAEEEIKAHDQRAMASPNGEPITRDPQPKPPQAGGSKSKDLGPTM